MTDDNLNDVFDDNTETTTEEIQEQVEVESKGEVEEDNSDNDNSEEVSEKEDNPEPEAETPSVESKEESWTKKAALDERKKRQALEQEIAELKKHKESDDGEDKPEPSIEDMLWRERATLTREVWADKHEDYEEMEAEFLDMCKENPALSSQLRASANPAKFAYTQAKNHLEAKKYSDPNYVKELEKDMREKIKAEVLAELKGETVKNDKLDKAALVNSVTKSTSVNSNSSKEELESLDDMFD